MSSKSPLAEKIVLVVDDEPDVLDSVGEMLDMCLLYKAKSFEEGLEYLKGFTIDIAILDIMGVNGLDLLKTAVEKGIPAVMLTAHALTPDVLKKSMKLGAVTFLPKEELFDLQTYLEDVVLGGGKPVWGKFFDRLGGFFDRRFGPDWKEKDAYFKEFEEAVKREAS